MRKVSAVACHTPGDRLHIYRSVSVRMTKSFQLSLHSFLIAGTKLFYHLPMFRQIKMKSQIIHALRKRRSLPRYTCNTVKQFAIYKIVILYMANPKSNVPISISALRRTVSDTCHKLFHKKKA